MDLPADMTPKSIKYSHHFLFSPMVTMQVPPTNDKVFRPAKPCLASVKNTNKLLDKGKLDVFLFCHDTSGFHH